MRALLEPFLLRRLKSDVATQLVAKSQQAPPSPLRTSRRASAGCLQCRSLWGSPDTTKVHRLASSLQPLQPGSLQLLQPGSRCISELEHKILNDCFCRSARNLEFSKIFAKTILWESICQSGQCSGQSREPVPATLFLRRARLPRPASTPTRRGGGGRCGRRCGAWT